jgi:hypothetical protein
VGVNGSPRYFWKALPRRSRSRGQTQATRGDKDPPQGQLACPVLLPGVETPVVAHRCFTLPRSSILYGCIDVPGRQVNAVWGRYPTACAVFSFFLLFFFLFLSGVYWGLVDKISPAFELRNSGVPAVVRSFHLPTSTLRRPIKSTSQDQD